MGQRAEIFTLSADVELEARYEASCILQQAIADVFPLDLYPQPTADTNIADELGSAIRAFYEHGTPAAGLPVFDNPRAKQILDYCMQLASKRTEMPGVQAHFEHLNRQVYAPETAIPYPRLRAL